MNHRNEKPFERGKILFFTYERKLKLQPRIAEETAGSEGKTLFQTPVDRPGNYVAYPACIGIGVDSRILLRMRRWGFKQRPACGTPS
jgi:hypothetical protein